MWILESNAPGVGPKRETFPATHLNSAVLAFARRVATLDALTSSADAAWATLVFREGERPDAQKPDKSYAAWTKE